MNSTPEQLRFPPVAGFTVRADFKNLLDAPHEILQGSVVRESYLGGRVVQAGLLWRP